MNPGRSLRVLALLFLAVLPTEKKPIRVFLQDGANDLDNLHGNWPLANQEMAAAPKFAGYDNKFE